jgi:hypothetical protein
MEMRPRPTTRTISKTPSVPRSRWPVSERCELDRLAAMNKCLAQNNKSRTGGNATKKRAQRPAVAGVAPAQQWARLVVGIAARRSSDVEGQHGPNICSSLPVAIGRQLYEDGDVCPSNTRQNTPPRDGARRVPPLPRSLGMGSSLIPLLLSRARTLSRSLVGVTRWSRTIIRSRT